MHRNQQFRRIGDFSEPLAGHFEHSQFGRRAETVLDAAENPVGAPVVPLELQDHIYDVLQNFRACDITFLGDMSDQQDGNPRFLRKPEQDRSYRFDLRN